MSIFKNKTAARFGDFIAEPRLKTFQFIPFLKLSKKNIAVLLQGLPVLFLLPMLMCAPSNPKGAPAEKTDAQEVTTMPNGLIVAELFTSQGCSSCPPADKLLGEIARRDSNFLLLSFHVDYWNYIGWKDPFAKKEFSDRQRHYGDLFQLRSIYTPQVIVNGKEEFVGSNAGQLNAARKKAKPLNASATLEIEEAFLKNHEANFRFSIKGDFENTTLHAALLSWAERTEVKAGENRNRLLENQHVVKYFESRNAVAEGTLEIPYQAEPFDQAVLYLQKADGEIIAAKTINITNLD